MEHNETEIPAQLPEKLLGWFSSARRDLPWRKDTEPYHVWVSEIMLQQTRVEAVREKYVRFLRELPTLESLAECSEEKLMKLWEGLGYYSRARSLQKTARLLAPTGRFPESAEELEKLPGIGPYTAGAIASICFEKPTPAVDGNVLRVMSRLLGIDDSVDRPEVKKQITRGLTDVYPAGRCGAFTQSLMELGATVCVPAGEPACGTCPVRELCRSAGGEWRLRPRRDRKKPRREENKTVLLLTCGDRLAVRKRPEQGLLAGLWEFPNVDGSLSEQEAMDEAESRGCEPVRLISKLERVHVFTHMQWNLTAYRIETRKMPESFVWVTGQTLRREYGLPSAFRAFLEPASETGEETAEP